MKKIIALLVAVTLGISLFGCSGDETTTTTGLNYEMFNYISDYDEIFDRREGDYLVYIYSDTCSICDTIKDTVLEFADTYTGHMIYFFEVTYATTELKTEFLSYIGLNEILFGTPSLVIVKDNSFETTSFSNYFFAGATDIPRVLRDIENGTYNYF